MVRVGNTKIDITVEGCFICGTRWSHRWEKLKEVRVQIGRSHWFIDISICGECVDNRRHEQLGLDFEGGEDYNDACRRDKRVAIHDR